MALASNEDNLWSKFKKLKSTLDNTRLDLKTGGGGGDQIFDDSGRLVDLSEVFQNLFIGSENAAKNTFYLKKIGVTHVLNTAEGSSIGLVDTNAAFYKPFNIAYKGLPLLDVAQTNIAMYFNETAEFIDNALKNGGKVLVNCKMGLSRSSTCVLAYLMLKQNMEAVEAVKIVRRNRAIMPNDGFLRQIADLDNKLKKERKIAAGPK